MTDKQIIINSVDGLSCANCTDNKRCQEQQAKKEYAINQVLQDIPSEYANVIARLKKIIPSITRCDYVLEKQLKRKEQECEELRGELYITEESLKDYEAHYNRQCEKLEKIKEIVSGSYETLDPRAKQEIEEIIEE